MNTDERWNLDRKPTVVERGIGIGGALLLCAVGMVGLWFSVFVKSNLVASLTTGAFTTLSMLFLVRFIFTGGRSLHRPEIIATAVVFTAVGLAMFAGSFFAESLRDKVMLLALGFGGIGGSVLNFQKQRKSPTKPPENNARDVT